MTVSPPLNPLVAALAPPPVPEAAAWRAGYDGRAGAMIDMAQAAPGYAPHPLILTALAQAAAAPTTATYGGIAGDPALRASYARHVAAVYGAPVGADEIAITTGCNMAFVVAAMAVAQRGDAVVVPTPWYFNHDMTLSMLGVETRPLPCRAEDGFLPDVARAEALIDDKVRAILLVTPNNPTGAIYPPQLIAAFARLCARRGLWLILDETYRDFLERQPPHGELAGPERGRILQLYSFSKAYCIPGHRLGAMLAPREAVPHIVKILDCLHICPPRAGQVMLPAAIEGLAEWREGNRREIAARAAAFSQALANTGWRIDSIGAYFAFVAHPFAGAAGVGIARALARELGVITLPASFFGASDDAHLRFAFANADAAAIAEVGRRLAEWRGPG